MKLTDAQKKHCISLLPQSSQVMFYAIENELNENPKNPDALEILLEISKKLGGHTYSYLSMGRKVNKYLRDLALIKDHQLGMTKQELAKKYNLSFPNVHIALRSNQSTKDE
jgi:Mor family transcriptional regulator